MSSLPQRQDTISHHLSCKPFSGLIPWLLLLLFFTFKASPYVKSVATEQAPKTHEGVE